MSAREVGGKREGKWNLSPTTRTLNHNYQPPPSCCSLVVAERARLRHLPWGDPTAAAAVRAELAPAGFDVVLGADVLYSEAAVPRLLASLACLLAPGGVAVLCYQERGVSGRAASLARAPHVYMRWKEEAFLGEGREADRVGLSIAGFYYVRLDRATGAVAGWWADPAGPPSFQRLDLKPGGRWGGGHCVGEYQFR